MLSSTTNTDMASQRYRMVWSLIVLLLGFLIAFFSGAHNSDVGSMDSTVELDDDEALVAETIYPFLPLEEDDLPAGENLVVMTYTNILHYAVMRLFCSANSVKLPLHVLGEGRNFRGFGTKIVHLRKALEAYKDDPKTIVLFVDAHDVLFYDGAKGIVEKFKKFDANVVISAEANCWPDKDLCQWYPPIEEGKPYLNSGLLIGYAPELYKVTRAYPVTWEDDDQLYYTRAFINEKLRQELNIKIDHRSELFQTFEGGANTVKIHFQDTRPVIKNEIFETEPAIVHTPGLCKGLYALLGNYHPEMWDLWNINGTCSPSSLESADFLTNFKLTAVDLDTQPSNDTHQLLLVASIKDFEDNLEQFLNDIRNQSYPKNLTHLVINNHLRSHGKLLDTFAINYRKEYRSFRLTQFHSNFVIANNEAELEECAKKTCDFRFEFGTASQMNNPHLLRHLMRQNRTFIAPMFFGEDTEATYRFDLRYRNSQCINVVEVSGNSFQITFGFF